MPLIILLIYEFAKVLCVQVLHCKRYHFAVLKVLDSRARLLGVLWGAQPVSLLFKAMKGDSWEPSEPEKDCHPGLGH